MSEITQILDAINQGDPSAADQLLPMVHAELRRLAAAQLAREAPGHTLQPTALVHEAYLRLVGPGDEARWNSGGPFFAAASEAMRRILVGSARRKARIKHGGEMQRVDLGAAEVPARPPTTCWPWTRRSRSPRPRSRTWTRSSCSATTPG
jgi:RNA polymerase sigma factor (TIGR02999 family)